MIRFNRRQRATIGMVFIALVLFIFVGGGAYVGLFASVTVEIQEQGPFRVIGVDRYGSLRKATLLRKQQVLPYLQEQGLLEVIGEPVALVDGALGNTPASARHSVIGYLVTESAELHVEPPLQVIDLPQQQSLVVTLNAHRSVAAFKAYRAIKDRWIGKLRQDGLVPVNSSLEIETENSDVRIVVPLKDADASPAFPF